MVIEELLKFWRFDEITDSRLRGFLMRPRVRIEIANLLVQSINNGRIKGSVDSYAEYAKGFVGAEDAELGSSAIFLLGLAGRRTDVKVFEEVLHSENENLFYSASLAISMNCFAEDDFNSVVEKIQHAKLKNHLQGVWRSYAEYRASRCRR